MKTTLITRFAVLLLAGSVLAACGKGFDASSVGEDLTNVGQGGSGNNGGGGSPQTPPSPSNYERLDLGGDVNGGNYDKEEVVALDKANNALLLYLPMSVSSSFVTLNIDVPQAQGVRVATYLDSKNNPRLAISIPLRLIVGRTGLTTLPYANKLPGNRPLPLMPSGEYPSTAVSMNALGEKLHMYIGVEAVGLFLENAFFPEGFGMTFPIRNKTKTQTYGFLTIVPKAGEHKGGLFLSFIMPPAAAVIIDDHLSSLIQ